MGWSGNLCAPAPYAIHADEELVSCIAGNDMVRGITIAAKSRLFQLWEVMPTFPGVKATEWYATTDPYFNRFPRALTPKIYRIAQNELDEHLSGARPLVRQGGRIFVKRT